MGAVVLGVVIDEPDPVASTGDRQGHVLVVVCIWPKRGTLAIADGAGIIPSVFNTEAGVIDLIMPDVPGVLAPVGREGASTAGVDGGCRCNSLESKLALKPSRVVDIPL